MLRQKKAYIFVLISLMVVFAQQLATAGTVVGALDYFVGEVSLIRAGAEQKTLEIGFPIENYDLIKTGPGGEVHISLDKATGYEGTIKIRPKSAFTIRTEQLKNSPATKAELMAGSAAIKETVTKAQKLRGEPSFNLATHAAVMGVRGTEFSVTISISNGVLVDCAQGAVVCRNDAEELIAQPGQAVFKKTDAPMKQVPLAVSSLDEFRQNWLAEEVTAFMADAPRAIDQFARLYMRMKADFIKTSDALASDPGLAVWMEEYRRGAVSKSTSVAVMKQKTAVARKIMAVRRVLFMFERVYYRLLDIQSQVGPATMGASLPSGGTVRDFYRKFDADKKDFEKRTAMYRFALKLYAERNDGHDPVSDLSDEGSFFDD